MKTFALAAIAGLAAASSEVEASFFAYITEYGKSYSTMGEFEMRLANFARNHDFINDHNVAASNYKVGHNKMSDWTEAEYKGMLTYIPEVHEAGKEHVSEKVASPVDWRSEGAVNEVQDQGQCGSCWTFSTITSFESARFIATGNLEKYAEQMLVDCDNKKNGIFTINNGCNGGNVSLAFKYLETHDAMYETDYHYTAKDDTCKYVAGSGANVADRFTVKAGDAEAMKTAVSQTPVSVAIQADKRVFQTYKSGIFDEVSCGTQLDHATAVVGWGEEDGQEFWIMRNSWGTTWGESGYMRVAIEEGVGICGIQMQVDYAQA